LSREFALTAYPSSPMHTTMGVSSGQGE